jgi:hypothetical protein
MGDVYALVIKATTKFPQSRLVLSGVFMRRDMSWRWIGALNSRYDWITKTLGITFLDLLGRIRFQWTTGFRVGGQLSEEVKSNVRSIAMKCTRSSTIPPVRKWYLGEH